jgi:phosphatidylglycerol:prolipoprotein diacylglycerol transferase
MNPILFHVGATPVYAYGFLLGLAILVGCNLALYLGRRENIPLDEMARGIALVAVSAVLGSRLLHLVYTPGIPPRQWLDLDGGIVAYGGFLGGALATYLYFGRRGFRFLKAADIMSPPVALGIALTRMGCFLAGCDFGTPTAAPWGVRFPRAGPAWREHLVTGASLGGERVNAASAWSLPVHPTQLYEAAAGLMLFGVLMARRRRERFDGELFLILTCGYGLLRTLIEVFRGDPGRGGIGVLSTSQVLGLATATVALVCWARLRAAAERTDGGRLSDVPLAS